VHNDKDTYPQWVSPTKYPYPHRPQQDRPLENKGRRRGQRPARMFSAPSALFISLGSAHPNIAAANFPIAAARLSLDFAA